MEGTRFTMLVLILAILSCVGCFELGLTDGNDFDDNDSGRDDSIFVSESTERQRDGSELITRESEIWTADKTAGKYVRRKVLKKFIRYPNGTVLQVSENHDRDASGSGNQAGTENQAKSVECITENDCKEEFFCDRLSLSCKACFKQNHTCHRQRECCHGHVCRDGKCDVITGKEGDPCASDKDCKKNHCCAFDNGRDICKAYIKEGDTCADGGLLSPRFPSFFTRKFIQNERRSFCPCLQGLECIKKDSYFLMSPKTCERVVKLNMKAKKESRKKKKKQEKKRRRITQDEMEDHRDEMEDHHRDEMEHDERIDDGDDDDEDDNEDHDRDDEDDLDEDDRESRSHMEDDDADDDEMKDSIIGKIPRLLQSILSKFFN